MQASSPPVAAKVYPFLSIAYPKTLSIILTGWLNAFKADAAARRLPMAVVLCVHFAGWRLVAEMGVTRLPGYDGSLALGVRQFEQECQLAFGLIHSRGDSLAWSAEGCSTGAWNDWASSVKDLQPTLKAELGIYVADLRV